MNIIYNGNLLKLDKPYILNDLLIKLDVNEPFAVAINNKFIPKILFNEIKIMSGDNVEIVYPMVGG